MRRFLTIGVAALAVLAWTSGAGAADPVTPFPAAHSGDVFVIAHTMGSDNAIGNYYKPGDTVTFCAYAVNGKTHKLVGAKDSRYFYVTVPGQPNVKLKYTTVAPAHGLYKWVGTWTVPAAYPLGNVAFKVLVQTKSKLRGSFVQVPVASAMLTIAATPPASMGNGPNGKTDTTTSKLDTVLYVDAVNGSRPTGAKPRPIGCTQTSVFKRGEQLVLRAWGFDLKTGEVLTMDNVTDAHFAVAGQPNITLNWGGHGAAGAKVWFWANAWNIPTDYALGDLTITVTFKLASGAVATAEYTVTIIP